MGGSLSRVWGNWITAEGEAMIAREIGECQICEGDFKLHHGTLVHHGYKRPGDGSIRGDCPGVMHEPYEQSYKLLERYLLVTRKRLADAEDCLKKLQRHDTYTLDSLSLFRRTTTGRTVAVSREDALRSALSIVESDIRSHNSNITRFERRIANWTPQEPRSVQEMEAIESGVKVERKAVRDAARAERDAKKEATRLKQEARDQGDRRLKGEFVIRLLELAARPQGHERERAVYQFLDDFRKRKYERINWLGVGGLRNVGIYIADPELRKQANDLCARIDAAGLELGLAELNPTAGSSVYWNR